MIVDHDLIEAARPAQVWEEAYPIGNGRMGAMVFGGIGEERIQLNEDSIWSGGAMNRVNPEARGALAQVRELIGAGRIPEAEQLLERSFSGLPESQRIYQPAGEVRIRWSGMKAAPGGPCSVPEPGGPCAVPAPGGPCAAHGPDAYRRSLRLAEGLVQEQFRQDGTEYEKEYLASYPAQVIAVRVRAAGKRRLRITLTLDRVHTCDQSENDSNDTIAIGGSCGSGNEFCIAVSARSDGWVGVQEGKLCVKDAGEAVIYIAVETSFYRGTDCRRTALERLRQAAAAGYEALRREHVADYQKLYGRVSLRLGPERDQQLAETYFQFGRYLLISCSRPGSQPANLQGIWNDSMTPPWGSKYTININTEMNYWPAEICNLSECHQPLFDLLRRMQPRGQEVAKQMYGCRGFVAHHNTDLWGDCAPQGIYMPATYWVMGAAWLCTHIWTHYRYTGDQGFLAEMFPVLEDAVLFFHDYLTEDRGEMVTCPSVSPENTYILPDGTYGRVCVGASMDSQILRDLFTDYLRAADVLGKAPLAQTRELLAALPPIRVGRHGQIMEWREDYEEKEPGHRHISQLYALHPSHQITVDGTPKLAQAAARTLERRLHYGGGHTGWSCAWIVNFYARLGRGDAAWENLKKLWTQSTFPNLMDNHPLKDGYVFQIDGNFGATAAIAEMLVQSDEKRTLLLPALPACWQEGEVSGLKLPGDGTVSLCWEQGRLKRCLVRAGRCPLHTSLVYGSDCRPVSLMPGEEQKIF